MLISPEVIEHSTPFYHMISFRMHIRIENNLVYTGMVLNKTSLQGIVGGKACLVILWRAKVCLDIMGIIPQHSVCHLYNGRSKNYVQ